MAKMRGNDSKAALAQQRAEVRRDAYGKQHIGEDGGSAAARQAMRERVHRMREVAHANQRAEQLAQEPLGRLVAHLAADSIRLVVELLRLPKRLLLAALGRQSQQPA